MSGDSRNPLQNAFVPSHKKLDSTPTSGEPDFCTSCGLQFEDGNGIIFDGYLKVTVGRTYKTRYVLHPGTKKVHDKPTCKEVKEEWKISEMGL